MTKYYKKIKECKKHKWRVGSSNAILKNKKIVKETLNIWCENCDKKILAHYNSDIKFKRRINNIKEKRPKGKWGRFYGY